MTESKKVPLFITDVAAVADSDIDEWIERMADHLSRVTGLPREEDDASPSDNPDDS